MREVFHYVVAVIIGLAIGLFALQAWAQDYEKYVMVVTWTLNPIDETVGPISLYTFPDHAHCQIMIEGMNEGNPLLQPVRDRLLAQVAVLFEAFEGAEDVELHLQCVPERTADAGA